MKKDTRQRTVVGGVGLHSLHAGDQRFNLPSLPDRPIGSTESIERARPFCSQLGTPCIAPKTVRAPVTTGWPRAFQSGMQLAC